MIRSTRAQKAERLRAARRLLADEIGMAEAAMALSREFGLSRRQAYRYLELARAGAPGRLPVENSVTVTLKMPARLASRLRNHATKRGVTTSEVIRRAVTAFLAPRRRHG
jgi:predicted DNA-binding transcriptional regulator YafY